MTPPTVVRSALILAVSIVASPAFQTLAWQDSHSTGLASPLRDEFGLPVYALVVVPEAPLLSEPRASGGKPQTTLRFGDSVPVFENLGSRYVRIQTRTGLIGWIPVDDVLLRRRALSEGHSPVRVVLRNDSHFSNRTPLRSGLSSDAPSSSLAVAETWLYCYDKRTAPDGRRLMLLGTSPQWEPGDAVASVIGWIEMERVVVWTTRLALVSASGGLPPRLWTNSLAALSGSDAPESIVPDPRPASGLEPADSLAYPVVGASGDTLKVVYIGAQPRHTTRSQARPHETIDVLVALDASVNIPGLAQALERSFSASSTASRSGYRVALLLFGNRELELSRASLPHLSVGFGHPSIFRRLSALKSTEVRPVWGDVRQVLQNAAALPWPSSGTRSILLIGNWDGKADSDPSHDVSRLIDVLNSAAIRLDVIHLSEDAGGLENIDEIIPGLDLGGELRLVPHRPGTVAERIAAVVSNILEHSKQNPGVYVEKARDGNEIGYAFTTRRAGAPANSDLCLMVSREDIDEILGFTASLSRAAAFPARALTIIQDAAVRLTGAGFHGDETIDDFMSRALGITFHRENSLLSRNPERLQGDLQTGEFRAAFQKQIDYSLESLRLLINENDPQALEWDSGRSAWIVREIRLKRFWSPPADSQSGWLPVRYLP